MEILPSIIADDLFIYLQQYHTFIISDTHIGFEDTLHKKGYLIPQFAFTDFLVRLERSLRKFQVQGLTHIIINGDLVHDFAKISKSVRLQLLKFFSILRKYGTITIITGNHDSIISSLIDDIPVVSEYICKDILITHGDTLPTSQQMKQSKIIIIGHEHPAISLQSGARIEQYKCFLVGTYKKKPLIVMPSCNLVSQGTDVLQGRFLSPYLPSLHAISNFEVYISADKIYDFGKIKDLQP
ncbi:MAG: metallophosphoesterase [Candidatus Woesearchaeota archaeon]